MRQYEKIVKAPIKVHRRQWHADGRGKLLESLRCDDDTFDFGQAYVTTILPNIIKAWHCHKLQTDRMLLLKGTVRFVAGREGPMLKCDKLKMFDTHLDFVVSDQDPYLIVIPPTFYHGFQNLGTEEAYILNIPTEAYNHSDPDELRVPPHGDCTFVFNWHVHLDG